MFLGVLSETLYFSDYWYPQSVFSFYAFSIPVLLEDILFGFSAVGIASTCYETLCKKKRTRVNTLSTTRKIFIMVGIGLMIYCASLILCGVTGINSIFSTAGIMFVFSLIILAERPDLLRPALFTSSVFLGLLFFIYSLGFLIFTNAEQILMDWWALYQHPFGIRIMNIPISEMVWAWCFGFSSVTLYSGATGVYFLPQSRLFYSVL
jgi:hypothetical protein